MTFQHTTSGVARRALTDEDRAALSAMEAAKEPTQQDRGRLAALRLMATDDADVQRTQALSDRWAGR